MLGRGFKFLRASFNMMDSTMAHSLTGPISTLARIGSQTMWLPFIFSLDYDPKSAPGLLFPQL